MATLTIEPLILIQSRAAEVTEETFTERWYGWDCKGGMSWCRKPVHPHAAFEATWACDVVLPLVMCGSRDEITTDVINALYRHAKRLGLAEF